MTFDEGILIGQLVILFGQLTVFALQAGIMRRQRQVSEQELQLLTGQADIARRQVEIAERLEEERKIKSVGTFFRLAMDLKEELAKVNSRVDWALVDPNTHPRQVLRTASNEFAPLGAQIVRLLNGLGFALDQYFDAVRQYSKVRSSTSSRKQEALESVQERRMRIGETLDVVNRLIPEEYRYRPRKGDEFNFTAMCTAPAITEAGEGDRPAEGPTS